MGHTGVICVVYIVCSTFLQSRVYALDTTWTNLRVKFNPYKVGEFKIPMTVTQAKQEGYVNHGVHKEFSPVSIYCLGDDVRACALYSNNDYLCGFRVGFIADKLSDRCPISSNYFYDKIASFQTAYYCGSKYYYVEYIFTNPVTLRNGGPKTSKNLLGDDIYGKPNGRDWIKFPQNEDDVLTEVDGIEKQACYPQMGQHYFFINETTECSLIPPCFALYHEKKLIGMGVTAFGSPSVKYRSWYEDVPTIFFNKTVSKPPPCFKEQIGKCGLIAFHLYFIDKPEEITCP